MAKSFFERITGSRPVREEVPSPRERTSVLDSKHSAKEEPELPTEISDEEGELGVDIYDDGDYIIIQAIVGGLKPEDLDVQVTDDAVTLRGRRARTHETKEENFYCRELYWGSFARSIILPAEVVSDEAEATSKNGLLTIRLPKRDRNKAQKLRIKSD